MQFCSCKPSAPLVTGQPAAVYLNKKFFKNLENKKGRTRLMKETETIKKHNGASTL